MDPTVMRLDTPEECEQYAFNVRANWPALAVEARRRSIELRADAHGVQENPAARESLEAIYAYDEYLSAKNGKKIKATNTRKKVDKVGIITTVANAVMQKPDPDGYAALKEMGLEELAFEAVVLRHPDAFTPEAVERAQERMKKVDA